MTAVLTDPAATTYVPGWGIYADLTPPELVTARRLRALRRTMLLGLAALAVAIVLVFAYTVLRDQQATDDLARQQATSTRLGVEQARYSVVTDIRGSTTAVRQQLAGLMAGEVDASGLLASVRTTLPTGTVLDAAQLTVDAGGGAAVRSGDTASLDTSGATHIGRVTLSGTSPRLSDIATYVDALSRRRGLVDVVPVTNQANGSAFTFTVAAIVTDAVLTQRYAVPGSTPTPTATAGTGR